MLFLRHPRFLVESVTPDDMLGGEAFTAHASQVLVVLRAVYFTV